jgi:hypothetical protein
MPGWLLSAGVQATHSGDPIPGWMQYDDGIQQDETGAVTHINGERLEKNRIYRVGESSAGQHMPLLLLGVLDSLLLFQFTI